MAGSSFPGTLVVLKVKRVGPVLGDKAFASLLSGRQRKL